MKQIVTINNKERIPKGYKLISLNFRDKYRTLNPQVVSNPYCYAGLSAKTVQNAFDYSGVYPKQFISEIFVEEQWIASRVKGFASTNRMSNKIKPLYYIWNSVRYEILSARRNIFLPLYKRSIQTNKYFLDLQKMYEEGTGMALQSFDTKYFDTSLKEHVANVEVFDHTYALLSLLTNETF